MGKIDFSVPQRMSGSTFVIIFLKLLRSFLNIFILTFIVRFFSSDRHLTVLWFFTMIIVCVVLALIVSFMAYWFKMFYVKDGKLIYMHGIVHRETITIPLDKIHSIRTKQGFFYRLFDMRGITFDTLASKSEEVELILNNDVWDSLLNQMKTEEKKSDIEHDHIDNKSVDTFRFKNLNLIKGALCQNSIKGFALLGAIIFYIFDQIRSVNRHAVEEFVNYVGVQTDCMVLSITDIIGVVLIAYLVALLLWIGIVFLRYYDMGVRIDGDKLSFQSGLISRYSNQFPYSKICTISVKRNFLEKKLKCCTIELRQALNATGEKTSSDVKIYGADSSEPLLRWWLGDDYGQSGQILSAKSGFGLLFATIKYDILISIVAILLFCSFGLYGWCIIPGIYMLISLVKGFVTMHRDFILLKELYIVINNGRYADVFNYVKYSNIEVVRIVRTPFYHLSGRVNLILSTNGSTFIIRSIKRQQANDIYELLLSKACE